MNPELCEFLEFFGTGILKVESGTLQIFGNFGYGNFKKNESRTLRIFGNFGYGNFQN